MNTQDKYVNPTVREIPKRPSPLKAMCPPGYYVRSSGAVYPNSEPE